VSTKPLVPALRSLNHRLSAFINACSQPGVTPTRLLTILSDSQTARKLLAVDSVASEAPSAPDSHFEPMEAAVVVTPRGSIYADGTYYPWHA